MKNKESNKIRVADYIIKFLENNGVGSIFLVPGGGSMYLCDALIQNKNVEYVPTHNEQSAAVAAEAYARVSGGLGCAIVTTGPGGTNAITGVAGSWIESVPLVIISGQVKTQDLMEKTGVRQHGVQEVDIVSIVKPITKYAVIIKEAEQIKYELEKAIHIAQSGRKGPVWIDVPLDIQAFEIDPEKLPQYLKYTDIPSSVSNEVSEIIELINKSKRPLLMAGHGVRISGAMEEFQKVYEILNIPVATTWNAMDLISYDHELSVGKPGVVALRGPNFIVQNSDLILVIGARLDNLVTAYKPQDFGRKAKIIMVDIDIKELNKFTEICEFEKKIECDAKIFLKEIKLQEKKINKSKKVEWLKFVKDIKNKYPINDGKAFPEKGKISTYHFTNILMKYAPENMLISTGTAGLAIEAFYTGFSNKKGQRIFLNTGLGAMGYGLPSMIGASIADGKRPFIAVETDGSMMMSLQELQTIITLKLPIRLFLLNNKGYASIRNTQKNYFENRFIGTGPEAKLGFPEFLEIAKVFGFDTLSINDASELEDRIKTAMTNKGPLFINVEIDEEETLWPKSSSIKLEDGTMESMPLEDMSPLLSREEFQSNFLN